MVDFIDNLIKEYAKRIYGFAYSKTNNTYDAEDLSQEILIILCEKHNYYEDVENMDAYVYRICHYTWANYLRKHKRHWTAVYNPEVLDDVHDSNDIEDDYIDKELKEKLRHEIMYLSDMRRKIIIMFYYDNKTGNEISTVLKIPASTVRWHISKIKNDLKERIEMSNDNGINPIRLNVGHQGWVNDPSMHGLRNNMLIQNVCYTCYNTPKTIEEIAKTIGVATVYIEDALDKMLYMDYIIKAENNKYKTNFFIRTAEYDYPQYKYSYENILTPMKVFSKLYDEEAENLKSIGFVGSDVDEGFLKWCLLTYILREADYIAVKNLQERDNYMQMPHPKRKDGSEHLVYAVLENDNYMSDKLDDEAFKDFYYHAGGNGIKGRGINDGVYSVQYDMEFSGGWREFNGEELLKLKRIREIILNGETPNDYDKELIAQMVELGYVTVADGKPRIEIPYLGIDEMNQYRVIKDRIVNNEELMKAFMGYHDGLAKVYDEFEIKDTFKPADERVYGYIAHAGLYQLMKAGGLKYPTEEEKKRLATFVWEDQV